MQTEEAAPKAKKPKTPALFISRVAVTTVMTCDSVSRKLLIWV